MAIVIEGKPLRGIGEPIWAAGSDTEIEECQLNELLLKLAVRPDVPLWLICRVVGGQASTAAAA